MVIATPPLPEKLLATAAPWGQPSRRYPALERDLTVDVAVVGAGITGITTAWLLRQAGCSVALLERGRAGAADTGHTTAHLTCVTDARLHELVRNVGEAGARALWEGGAAAIEQIAWMVERGNADCNFRRVPGYLHLPVTRIDSDASRQDEIARLQEDAELAARMGFDARFVGEVPHAGVPGVRFGNQAVFHPGRYLSALLEQIPDDDSFVFEDTSVDTIEDDPRRVLANDHEVRCRYVVLATHNPLMGSVGMLRATLFQTKLSLYTTYVLRARLPAGTLPDVLYWDVSDPYDYLRIEPHHDHQLAIFGGADTKTGQQEPGLAFASLEARLSARLPEAVVTHRWLGQVIETDDGLPFIGEHCDGEFIATGYGGNGFTFGTLAAMMARDAVTGTSSPWSDLLRVDRKPFHGGVWNYLRENFDYPRYLLRDRLSTAEAHSLAQVPIGEGRIVALPHSGKCAVYRSVDGQLSICSATCTHLKCVVHWNAADRTWDCPCHGSRFATRGEVLAGPAEEPLRRIEVPGAE